MSHPTSFPKEKIKLLMLEGVHPSALKLFKDQGYNDIETLKTSLDEDELLERIKDVHLLGIRSKTQLHELPLRLI